ncbi:two-component system, sensor histidine kinase YesM [Fontibacillus panacisegetis]|uniref:Two-component system, sensor histidine kinase YesM n=1 Tax=Fontibacillus panacisegetis TaxID=670482 RepID=A0A1G7HD36_9BACL|nr:histidine kinase [Fontibacillus panacisegetis]SDE98224.1 two-component system, sensor histidine kinase YesM [Fontibacillus panacisegetis]
MKNFWGRLQQFKINGSVRIKLLLAFFIAAVLPVGALSYFSFHKSSEVVNSQFGSYGMYAVEQLKIHIDTDLRQMDQITGNILTYLIASSIYIGEEPPTTYTRYVEERDFHNYLTSLGNNMFKVAVITPSGRIIGNDLIVAEKLTDSEFWTSIAAYDTRHVSIHIPDYYSTQDDAYVISLMMPLKNSFGLPNGSKILIDMKADTVIELIKSFEKDTRSHLQIRDQSGQILLQTSTDFVHQDDDIVWSRSLDMEDWIVEARIRYAEFYESSTVILRYSILISALAILLGIGMSSFFSFRFTMPIKKLAHSMRRFGEGDLLIRTPVMSKDELGFLSESFNKMTEQLVALVHEISHTEKLKSEAELQILHYQINPHLLFNTLNSIQWKAKLAHQPEIHKMLQHLIVVLDGSFNFKQTLIPLKKELDIACHFIEIQRYRYDDAFTFELEVESGLDDCLIPRMVFQPLLENIFFHGFRDGQGNITMKVFSERNELYMVLEDDGIGVKPEHMEFIAAGRKIPDKQGGLGLRNVDERFKLHYGSGYGLSIESNRNQGTKVTLSWLKTTVDIHL